MTSPKDVANMSMVGQFQHFLKETNALALAVAVVIGGAVAKLVTSLVQGVFMPVIGLILPGGAWREIKISLDSQGNALAVGDVLGSTLDFLIVALVVFLLSTKVLGAGKPAK